MKTLCRFFAPRSDTSSTFWIDPLFLVTPRRYDIAVKTRFFYHQFRGDDPDAERIYRWHIEKRCGRRFARGLPADGWKRNVNDYVTSAKILLTLIQKHGFVAEHAAPIDPNGELLDGAHRVSCALALGIKKIPVTMEQRRVSAPPWGREWFVANGMGYEDLERLCRDWKNLKYAL